MEDEGSKRPRSFEDAAFALVQALSPGKQLKKEQIPFKQLRQVINEFVDGNGRLGLFTGGESPATASESSKAFGIDDKNGGSNLDLSDDSSSRISFDDSQASRSRNMFRSKSYDKIKSRRAFHNFPKPSRKMAQIRQRRREAMQIKEFVPIDCSEEELPQRFQAFCKEQLSCRATSVEVFQIVLNSLRNFFHHNTWSDNVEKLSNDFLKQQGLKTHSELESHLCPDAKSISDEELLKEYELMILIELHLLHNEDKPCGIEDTDVLAKMRRIYISGGTERMQKFLDEPVTDLFAHLMPKVMVQIYDALDRKIPCDLENFTSVENSTLEADNIRRASPVIARKISQVESLDRLLKEEDSDSEYKPSTSALPDANLAPVKAKPLSVSGRRPARPRPSLVPKSETDSHASSKRRSLTVNHPFVIPETPEAKVRKRKRSRGSESDDNRKMVKQTPLAKISKVGSKRTNKYSALLRKSSSRPLLNGSSLNDGLHSPTASPPRRFSTRAQARDHFLPSPPQPSSSTNIPARSNGMRKPSFQEKLALCGRQPSSDSALISPQPQHEKGKDEFVLEKHIVDKYRKRLEFVRHTQRKADKNEVFYGRNVKRSNLFDHSSADEMSVGVITRSAAGMTVQKNRSGRSVDSSRVHLAHALLNVHNSEPLNPSKAPKSSPFKLHRMVRPATKSDRRKLSKLKLRFSRERLSISVSASNSPATEASSVPIEA